MNQHHYRKLKEYCEFGELRHKMSGYRLLLLNMAICKLGRCILKELRIKKMLDFIVLKLNKGG